MSDERFSRYAGLPEPVLHLMKSAITAEFATLTAAGAPIDTPAFCFASPGLASIDIATGLAYPAKAERARRNPKVGMLLEGSPDEPVVCIAGLAAVRDADIQANVDRYLAETSAYLHTTVGDTPWSVVREAIWYWSRIIVQVAPRRILWWDSPAALDEPPQVWTAPAEDTSPASDPAPPGGTSAPPGWALAPWREAAEQKLAAGTPAHLSVVDDDGFPRPCRARGLKLSEHGFTIELPKANRPARPGPASLTFAGAATFVGAVQPADAGCEFAVERMLPTLPMMADVTELWAPKPETRERLMGRLTHELERRGLPLPATPEQLPAPTPWSHLRAARRGAAPAARVD
jgi:hypothetical protein